MCLNIGTSNNGKIFHLGQMENLLFGTMDTLLFLAVPIFKQIRVSFQVDENTNLAPTL